MGITATCHCGSQFMAKIELAGQTVKCPTCGQAFQVPNPAAAANQSTFQVACQCGRTYQVQATMAGRSVRCKACSQQFVVPPAPATIRQTTASPVVPTPDPLGNTVLGLATRSVWHAKTICKSQTGTMKARCKKRCSSRRVAHRLAMRK